MSSKREILDLLDILISSKNPSLTKTDIKLLRQMKKRVVSSETPMEKQLPKETIVDVIKLLLLFFKLTDLYDNYFKDYPT